MSIDTKQVQELLLQALETERGGIDVYQAAIGCAVNEDLKEEWTEYLGQTREVVRHIGRSLVQAMELAQRGGGTPEAAQLVAAECVAHAETRDHMNWELIGAAKAKASRETILRNRG